MIAIFSKDKNKIVITLFLIIITTSCSTIDDPVKKYNDEFLKNNYLKIKNKKEKHLKIAKENEIYYRDDKTDLIDSKYYNPIRGTKLKKEYRNRLIDEDYKEKKDNIKYLDNDMSIYYRERTLKDTNITNDCDYNCDVDIAYLENNYKDYSQSIVSFKDTEPNSEQLYGSLELRRDKSYNYIDSAVMQKNFDYIDIMNRTKKELYLKEKERKEAEESKSNSTITNIKDKFKNLFK